MHHRRERAQGANVTKAEKLDHAIYHPPPCLLTRGAFSVSPYHAHTPRMAFLMLLPWSFRLIPLRLPVHSLLVSPDSRVLFLAEAQMAKQKAILFTKSARL